MKTTMPILNVLVLVTLTARLQAQNTYTNASLRGEYILAESGSGAGGVVTVLGKLKTDGNGFLTGEVYQRLPGRVASAATAEGRYVINQDGTGSMTIRYNMSDSDSVVVDPGVVRSYDLVLTQNGATAMGFGAGVLSTVGLEPPIGSSPCSVGTLKGVYGFKESGVVNFNIPAVSIGEFQFDGIGGVRGNVHLRTGEVALPQTVAFDGTYVAEASGTGEIRIQYSAAEGDTSEDRQIKESRFRFILAADGVLKGTLKGIRLDSNIFTLAEFQKQ